MRRLFGAAGFVAVLGTLTASMFSADSGMASANEADISAESEILIAPEMISSDETEENNEELASGTDHHDLVIISEPATDATVPETEEKIAEAPKAASLSELVAAQDHQTALSSEMECLAGTVYFESKGEALAGQLAVAEVVLARRDSRRWPNSICGVVYQKSQFSFVRGGRMPSINKSSKAWRNAVAIAQIATDSAWDSPVKGSYFFHARYVSPGWRLQRVGSVGNHIFYR